MAKAWLRQRWELLFDALDGLTVQDEAQIAAVCAEEIQTWKDRPSMKSLSSLKEPMTDTRNALRDLPLTDTNSYLNPKTGQREHIALKYLNYSEAEWAEMNAASEEKAQHRKENRQFIDQPDAVVAKAAALLKSKQWAEVAVGLAVTTGRRLSEVLRTGEFHPKTRYSVIFSGQLKRKDEVLPPYEIPTLVDADLVLSAYKRLRKLVDCSGIEVEQISVRYGPDVVEAARKHFSGLVPAHEGGDLYTHLFRSVYGRIAVYYYAKPQTSDLLYMATIYGHYWVKNAEGKRLQNYASTLHYNDYIIGDGKGNIDGRQGIHLGQPGVMLLEEFQEKSEVEKKSRKAKEKPVNTLEKKKDHSITRMAQETKTRIDQVQEELQAESQDATLKTLIDEHYQLQQIIALVTPLYERLQMDSPVGVVQHFIEIDQALTENYQSSLSEVQALLSEAKQESETPVAYLSKLVTDKRDFKKSYEKRHKGKDYQKASLAELRRTKTTEAALERFDRAIAAIMQYNDTVEMPEMRWFINAAVVVDLVGGRPSDVKQYLEETRKAELDAHHKQYGLRPGYNRRPIPITARITVPEYRVGVQPEQPEQSEGEPEQTQNEAPEAEE